MGLRRWFNSRKWELVWKRAWKRALEPWPISGENNFPYWTVKDPSGHLIHTLVSCDKDDAIDEWLSTEQAMNLLANAHRVLAGEREQCTPSWEQYEAEGFSVVRCKLEEEPSR